MGAEACWKGRGDRIFNGGEERVLLRASFNHPAPGELATSVSGSARTVQSGGAGMLHGAFEKAGFRDIVICSLAAPLRMNSAAECVRFERESFGALHQMMASLDEAERIAAWEEIERELHQFDSSNTFEAPCDLIVGAASSAIGQAEPGRPYPE